QHTLSARCNNDFRQNCEVKMKKTRRGEPFAPTKPSVIYGAKGSPRRVFFIFTSQFCRKSLLQRADSVCCEQ
ncbi:MAG: hypothetical protein AAFQ04_06520, partial [Pseudomonadota bacterium]